MDVINKIIQLSIILLWSHADLECFIPVLDQIIDGKMNQSCNTFTIYLYLTEWFYANLQVMQKNTVIQLISFLFSEEHLKIKSETASRTNILIYKHTHSASNHSCRLL